MIYSGMHVLVNANSSSIITLYLFIFRSIGHSRNKNTQVSLAFLVPQFLQLCDIPCFPENETYAVLSPSMGFWSKKESKAGPYFRENTVVGSLRKTYSVSPNLRVILLREILLRGK